MQIKLLRSQIACIWKQSLRARWLTYFKLIVWSKRNRFAILRMNEIYFFQNRYFQQYRKSGNYCSSLWTRWWTKKKIYARVRIDVTPSSAVWICLHFHGPLSPNSNLITANVTIESPPSQQSTSIIKAIVKREVKVRDGLIEGGYSTNLSAMNRFGK